MPSSMRTGSRKYLDLRKKRYERPREEVLAPTLTVKEAAKKWLEEHVQHNRTAQNHRDAAAEARRIERVKNGTKKMGRSQGRYRRITHPRG